MSNRTQLFDLTEEYEVEKKEATLREKIVDLSLPLEERIDALNRDDESQIIENLNKLGTMYEMSKIKVLRTYLFAICEQSDLEPFYKSFAAKSLQSCDEKDELGYKAIDMIYPNLDEKVSTPYKIDLVKLLMKHDDFKEKSCSYFFEIINNQKLNCNFRYKTMVSLENEKTEDTEEKYNWILKYTCILFLENEENEVMYRILSAQFLLQKLDLEEGEKEKIENVILEIALNEDVEYNLRADATDVLLQYSEGDMKKRAQEIIMDLGRNGNVVRNIYDNAQNVHSAEIEESVKEAIEYLHGIEIIKNNGIFIDLSFVENEILKMLKDEENEERIEKIKVALNRISMDNALYGKYNCTLSHILLRLWSYIKDHKHEDDLRKRLLEELEEMAGTCSSGFVSRLINTMSGFGDFSLRISWRDQIFSNLSGRLNKLIQDMDNLRLQEKVLDQMTLETDNYRARKHFLKFLRENILGIRQEMYKEFTEHIEDADFDLYFRGAVSMYEIGRFI